MTSSPTMMVGVERLWYRPTNSRTASRSLVMSFSSNATPLSERWLFAQVQGGQPGWLNTITFFVVIGVLRTPEDYRIIRPPLPRVFDYRGNVSRLL